MMTPALLFEYCFMGTLGIFAALLLVGGILTLLGFGGFETREGPRNDG